MEIKYNKKDLLAYYINVTKIEEVCAKKIEEKSEEKKQYEIARRQLQIDSPEDEFNTILYHIALINETEKDLENKRKRMIKLLSVIKLYHSEININTDELNRMYLELLSTYADEYFGYINAHKETLELKKEITTDRIEKNNIIKQIDSLKSIDIKLKNKFRSNDNIIKMTNTLKTIPIEELIKQNAGNILYYVNNYIEYLEKEILDNLSIYRN